MTPFEIRLQLLQLARMVLTENKDRETQEAYWAAEKAGHQNILKLPRLAIADIVIAANELGKFIDQKQSKE